MDLKEHSLSDITPTKEKNETPDDNNPQKNKDSMVNQADTLNQKKNELMKITLPPKILKIFFSIVSFLCILFYSLERIAYFSPNSENASQSVLATLYNAGVELLILDVFLLLLFALCLFLRVECFFRKKEIEKQIKSIDETLAYISTTVFDNQEDKNNHLTCGNCHSVVLNISQICPFCGKNPRKKVSESKKAFMNNPANAFMISFIALGVLTIGITLLVHSALVGNRMSIGTIVKYCSTPMMIGFFFILAGFLTKVISKPAVYQSIKILFEKSKAARIVAIAVGAILILLLFSKCTSCACSSSEYNKNDPYYSKADKNSDGKLNGNEFQDAVNDYMNKHGY